MRRRREGVGFRFLLVFMVLVLVVAVFLLYRDRLAGLAPTAPAPATAPAPTEGAEEDESFPVGIRVVDAPSWLTVTVDGQTVLDQLGEPGFSEEFEVEQEIIIDAENAEAVRVEDGGEDVGPLGEGAVRFMITAEGT